MLSLKISNSIINNKFSLNNNPSKNNNRSKKLLLNNVPYSNKLSFSGVKPENCFIDIIGFGKDIKWAENAVSIIEDIKSSIKSGSVSFTEILDNTGKKYNNYFKTQTSNDKFVFEDKGRIHSGINRTGLLSTEVVGRYRGYFDRAADMVLKGYTKADNRGLCHVRNAEFNDKLELTTSCFNIDDYVITWEHTPAKNIPELMNHVSGLYENTAKTNLAEKSKNSNTLDKINKNIAEIHWYFAHAVPFVRGSAGICDILCKGLYEALNIELSPWKKGVSPDLEAFVTPLETFKENYSQYIVSEPKFKK